MKSTQTNNIQNSPKSKHLSLIERQQIERWLHEKVSMAEIANRLGRHKSSISREVKRGISERINSDLTKSYAYRWDVAQRDYEKNKGGGRRYPRLHSSPPILQPLVRLITKNRLSPYSAMSVLQKQGHVLNFSLKTLYNHIGRANFPISRAQLPHGRYRRRKAESESPCRNHKNLKGESIDNRPEIINSRHEAGHHEMDLVVGAKGGKKALLVITERVTRYQHIVLIKDKTQKSVIRALNSLERKLGKEHFPTLFKSITCDNGVEFRDFKGIEKSFFSKKKKRTKVYFAHPYSSFERGSNENANRLIRRFLPKGSTFDKLSQRVVQRLANWMNKIPRKIFNGKSANEKNSRIGFWGCKALRTRFFKNALHLNLQFTFHTSDYADGTQYAAGHQCCFAVTSTSEPESGCIGGDGQWQYTNLIPLYTWEIQVRHAADTVSHLTADEHAGLLQLLANKDALLALINH